MCRANPIKSDHDRSNLALCTVSASLARTHVVHVQRFLDVNLENSSAVAVVCTIFSLGARRCPGFAGRILFILGRLSNISSAELMAFYLPDFFF